MASTNRSGLSVMSLRRPPLPRKRAAVLIVSIGVLTILGVMAFLFVSLAKTERSAAASYVDLVRAKLYAQSGVERAVFDIQQYVSGNGGAGPFMIAEGQNVPWAYTGSTSQGPSTPLERAVSVSYQLTAPQGQVQIAGMTNADGGNLFGVSAFFPSTYIASGVQSGDYYALRVADAGGELYLNGSDDIETAAGSITALSPSWRRVLNNLGAAVTAVYPALALPASGGTALGERVNSIRASMGRNILTKTELVGAAPPYLTQAQFDILKPYITAHAWVDKTTLRFNRIRHVRPDDPTPAYDPAGGNSCLPASERRSTADTLALLRRLTTENASCADDILIDCDRDISVFHGGNDHITNFRLTAEQAVTTPNTGAAMNVLLPRAPVNINTAPREVLVAVLMGLQGEFLNGPATTNPPQPVNWNTRANMGMGQGYNGSAATTVTIGPAPGTPIIVYIVNEIIKRRLGQAPYTASSGPTTGGPFSSWAEWEQFVDYIAPGFGSSDPMRNAQRNLLKAAFNPNTHCNKFNPDSGWGRRFGEVDKVDIINGTTEFSFRSNGFFEIDSIGRVLSKGPQGGNPPPWTLVAEQKVTTVVRVYDVFKHSTQRDFVTKAYPNIGSASNITTYPENMADLGGLTAGSTTAAEWDGQLLLRTLDDGDNGSGTLMFRKYTDSYNSGSGAGDSAGTAEEDRSLISNSNLSQGSQSELFADGVFVHESRRYPNYSPSRLYGNNGFNVEDYIRYGSAGTKVALSAGTVEFWVKPAWAAEELQNTWGHSCPADPGFDVGSGGDGGGGHFHPSAEDTRTFFAVGHGNNHSQGHQEATNRMVIAARRYASAAQGGSSTTTGFFIAAYRGNQTRMWSGDGFTGGSRRWHCLNAFWGQLYFSGRSAPLGGPTTVDPRSWSKPGNWHHIVFQYSGTSNWLMVDGIGSSSDSGCSSIAKSVDSTLNSNYSVYIGSNRHTHPSPSAASGGDRLSPGFVCNGDSTIDAVRTYTSTQYPTGGMTPPSRYQLNGAYTGQFLDGTESATINPGGTIASVSATIYFPWFNTQTSSATMTVATNAGVSAPLTVSAGPAPSNPTGAMNAGRGGRVLMGGTALPITTGSPLRYTINLSQNGNWVVGSPIVEDLQVTFVPSSVKFYYYYFN